MAKPKKVRPKTQPLEFPKTNASFDEVVDFVLKPTKPLVSKGKPAKPKRE